MNRPSKRKTFLDMARLLAEQSTCARRRVGCLLVDQHGHIIGSGYNGVAKDMTHCIDIPCRGAHYPSGTGLDKCEAVHAEQNALMRCHDVDKIHACFTTVSPCIHCIKMLMNTSCKLLIFEHVYDSEALDFWMSSPDRNYSYIGV